MALGPALLSVRTTSGTCGDELACAYEPRGGETAGLSMFLDAGEEVRVFAQAGSACETVEVFVERCVPDADGDGICENLDRCVGDDATGDGDGDGICTDVDGVCDLPGSSLGSAVGAGVFTGSTCGGADLSPDSWGYTECRSDAPGPQHLLYWTAPSAGQYQLTQRFELSGSGSAFDDQRSVLWLASPDCAADEIACGQNGGDGGRVRTLVRSFDAGESVVVGLDTELGGGSFCGDVSLDVFPCSVGDLDDDGVCDDRDPCLGDHLRYNDGNGNGTCDPHRSVYSLGGAPGVAPGETLRIVALGAWPDTPVWAAVGWRGLQPPSSQTCLSGACLEVARPTFFGPVVSGSEGNATFEVVVPASAPIGTELVVQVLWRDGSGHADASSVKIIEVVTR